MKWFEKQHTFPHDWGTVTAAFWQKYPNQFQPHVLRVDTIDRTINRENNTIRTRRLHFLAEHAHFLKRLLGLDSKGYAMEECTIDLNAKTLTLNTHNLSDRHFLIVEETCVYSVHPDNPNHTLYSQKASCAVGQRFGRWQVR
eukprot:GHVN01097075.1.p1 GENE.GHVN01097075.1~~GHVN01097075.1.p1  ORF type:complete len:142 (-),score=13.20 GHVN01097075.1:986-1411(-)